MARKDLLKGLMEGSEAPSLAPAPQRPVSGAIGAVSKSISEMRQRSIIDIPTQDIENAGIIDRLDQGEGIDTLKQSLLHHGQQVPVLVRHHPKDEGRYQIVYGRRRVAALTALGLPVKALVRSLDDQQLIVAQGQENTARKDLSFIEKANFARQMRDQGYDRRIICDALSVDKTVISRMLSVCDALPPALLHAIGHAPSAGRDRWQKLVNQIKDKDVDGMVAEISEIPTSDKRFDAVMAQFQTLKPEPAKRTRVAGPEGSTLATISRATNTTSVHFDPADDGFGEWLIAHLGDLHNTWKRYGSDQGQSDDEI